MYHLSISGDINMVCKDSKTISPQISKTKCFGGSCASFSVGRVGANASQWSRSTDFVSIIEIGLSNGNDEYPILLIGLCWFGVLLSK